MEKEEIKRRIDYYLSHIAEQVEKTQYLNALATAHSLEGKLLELLDDVLKGK